MFKLLYTSILVLALSASAGFAKDFKLPEKKPVLSVTIPDDWDPEEIDHGVKGQSEDDAVFLSIESTKSEKGMEAIMTSTFDMLKEHKVEFDKDSKKTQKFKIAGQDAEEMIFSGKDEDGPATISITLFTVGSDVFVLTYWATTEKAEKHMPDVGTIVKSMKLLK